MSAAVAIDGVAKRFGTLQALAGVSLEIAAGEFFALLGPNGAGKTTLISTLAGLVRPDAGSIPILAMTANAFVEDRRRAYEAGMNEHLTKPLEPEVVLRTLAKYRSK